MVIGSWGDPKARARLEGCFIAADRFDELAPLLERYCVCKYLFHPVVLMQFQADKVASARFGSALLADRESDELWPMVWSIGQHCDLRIEPRLYPLDGGVEILYSDETNAVKGGFTLWTPASREVFDRKWICGAVERLRAAWYHNLS